MPGSGRKIITLSALGAIGRTYSGIEEPPWCVLTGGGGRGKGWVWGLGVGVRCWGSGGLVRAAQLVGGDVFVQPCEGLRGGDRRPGVVERRFHLGFQQGLDLRRFLV